MVEVTHPERIVFPEDGITKGDVVAYYEKVAGRMLPFVADRALTVHRFPQGIDKQGFMQKNAPAHYPEDLIRRFEVPKEGGGTTVYPVIDSTAAVGYFANLGVITFHVPPVRVEDEDRPDWIIWDLDPPDDGLARVRAAAVTMRGVLDDLGIPTLLLASGSKGYHLRARLAPTVGSDGAATVARGIAALAAAAHDDLLTLAFRRADRGSRVFVDWLRNAPRSTSVAPWSLRARKGAPAAVPLDWEELGTMTPDGATLESIEDRFAGDPWAGSEPVDIADLVDRVDALLDEAGIVLEPFDRFRS